MIDAAARRNFQTGNLTKENKEERFLLLKLTDTGHGQLQNLLLCDPGELVSPATQAIEAIQFCLLDTASPPTTEMVLTQMQDRQKKRLANLRRRCLNFPQDSRYMNLWMGMEQSRLAAVEQMLTMVSNDSDKSYNTIDLLKLTQWPATNLRHRFF